MDLYTKLIQNPPKLEVKKDAREVIVNLVSCMCDNKHIWKFKKNEDGDYKINTCGFAFSNFQTRFRRDEIEWEADEQNWDGVFKMINSGTSKIQSVKSR